RASSRVARARSVCLSQEWLFTMGHMALAALLNVHLLYVARPLVGFALASTPLLGLSAAFAAFWVYAATYFGPNKADALVFPGAALLWLGAAFYLVMLGLVAEVALSSERTGARDVPTAWEVR